MVSRIQVTGLVFSVFLAPACSSSPAGEARGGSTSTTARGGVESGGTAGGIAAGAGSGSGGRGTVEDGLGGATASGGTIAGGYGAAAGGSGALQAGAAGSVIASGGTSISNGGSGNVGASGTAGASAGGSGTAGAFGTAGGSGTAGAASTSDPGTEGDGDFKAGPTYAATSDVSAHGNPAGKSFSFTMSSTNSKYFTGLDATLSSPKTFTRRIDVYIPARYKDGAPAPIIVIQDGGGTAFGLIKLALDNLTIDPDPARRLPAFIAIAVANGGGDGKGSERGLEYDTMSNRYARFVDDEVLSAILSNTQVRAAYPNLAFTKDPEGRATVGCSSGGAAAFTMAWFAPQLFRRVIAYSTTLVDQQDDDAPEERTYRFGAWEYHSEQELIRNVPTRKPVRMFINANDRDNGYDQPESGHHNWLMANQRTAAALKAQGYHYRFVLGQNAGHCEAGVQRATMGEALRWVWRGYNAE